MRFYSSNFALFGQIWLKTNRCANKQRTFETPPYNTNKAHNKHVLFTKLYSANSWETSSSANVYAINLHSFSLTLSSFLFLSLFPSSSFNMHSKYNIKHKSFPPRCNESTILLLMHFLRWKLQPFLACNLFFKRATEFINCILNKWKTNAH